MTFEMLGQVNWLAVIVGALIYFALGALWYSPILFARPWQAAIGWDESRPQPQTNPMTYVGPLIAQLVGATATALFAEATGTDTIVEGVILGLIIGLGFALTFSFVQAVFDPNKPKPWVWFAITGAYDFVGYMIIAVIYAGWA